MRLLILSRIFEVYSTQRLVEEAQALGHMAQLWTPADPYEDLDFKPDVVIARFGTYEFQQSLAFLQHFEKQNIPVINTSQSYQLSHNKWTVARELLKLEIPAPKSWLWSPKQPPPYLNFPVVLKKLNSSQGRGVHLVNSLEELLQLRSEYPEEDLLLQEWIADARGEDYRAFVIGDQVVAGMKRTAAPGDFRSNLHLGGLAEKCELTEEEKKWALQLCRHLGLQMAGIDFLRSHTGSLLLEANPCPGLEGIEACTGINLARRLVSFARDFAVNS